MDHFDHMFGWDEQEDHWESQYADELDRLMEAQYHAELASEYEGDMYPEEYEMIGLNNSEMTFTIKSHEESLPHQLLHLSLGHNDAKAATVGEYLGLLLSTLWLQGEGFSGKRPFGNSDWQYVVYIAMAKAGMIELTLDEDGYVDVFTQESQLAADELILQAIRLAYDHEG